jgi:CRISPR/Cas system Type II protein with McrA/HNH and RuvC-like nuclease domain
MECNRKSASLRYKGNGNPSSLKLSEEDRVFKDRESNIRVRANAKKLEFSIDYIFLKELYYKQEGKCAYSGLPMQLKGKRKANEEVFSVDRIDSSKGYIKDNIVLCLNIMNRFKGDVTLEFFTKICKAIGERYNGKS